MKKYLIYLLCFLLALASVNIGFYANADGPEKVTVTYEGCEENKGEVQIAVGSGGFHGEPSGREYDIGAQLKIKVKADNGYEIDKVIMTETGKVPVTYDEAYFQNAGGEPRDRKELIVFEGKLNNNLHLEITFRPESNGGEPGPGNGHEPNENEVQVIVRSYNRGEGLVELANWEDGDPDDPEYKFEEMESPHLYLKGSNLGIKVEAGGGHKIEWVKVEKYGGDTTTYNPNDDSDNLFEGEHKFTLEIPNLQNNIEINVSFESTDGGDHGHGNGDPRELGINVGENGGVKIIAVKDSSNGDVQYAIFEIVGENEPDVEYAGSSLVPGEYRIEVDDDCEITFEIEVDNNCVLDEIWYDGPPVWPDENNQLTIEVQRPSYIEFRFIEKEIHELKIKKTDGGTVKIIASSEDIGINTEDLDEFTNPIEITSGETNIYSLTKGEITFEILAEDGYILDEIWFDWRPEWPDGNQLKIMLERDTDIEFSFIKQEIHELNISRGDGGTVEIIASSGLIGVNPNELAEFGEIIQIGTTETSIYGRTKETITFHIKPVSGKKIGEIREEASDGHENDIFLIEYDGAKGGYILEYMVMKDCSLKFSFEDVEDGHFEDIAILKNGGNGDYINKIIEEYADKGILLEANKINLGEITEKTSENSVGYGIQAFTIGSDDSGIKRKAYLVESDTNVVFVVEPDEGSEKIFVTEGFEPRAEDLIFEIDEFESGYLSYYGVYGFFMAAMSDISDSFTEHKVGGIVQSSTVKIEKPFYLARFHAMSGMARPDGGVSWYNFALTQKGAQVLEISGPEGGFKNAIAWDLDKYAQLNDEKPSQQVYFGNEEIFINIPLNGIGDIEAINIDELDGPGYICEVIDGKLKIKFKSGFYERVEIPLIVTLEDGGTVEKTLSIHRVGVEIQEHDEDDGNPSKIRNTWHGTQFASKVDLNNNGFQLTASYYIPDDEIPFGLFVTREYADGRIEREIIEDRMEKAENANAPYDNGIYSYAPNSVNVADYLIYKGTSKASAPVKISVLVLKDNPEGDNFGGLVFGSGLGVSWNK